MQISRGLFRLWVVASVLWVLVVGLVAWVAWPAQTDFFDAFKSTLPDAPPWERPVGSSFEPRFAASIRQDGRH